MCGNFWFVVVVGVCSGIVCWSGIVFWLVCCMDDGWSWCVCGCFVL